jgi:outer membrane protein insertion porin family
MMVEKLKTISIIACLFALTSCSVSKYIPEGEKLYVGGAVKLKSDGRVEELVVVNEELQELLRPKPNSQFFGMKIGLRAWYKAQAGKSGFINKRINKKFGQAPIYLSDINIDVTEELLDNRLENRGFFRSQIDHTISVNKKFASINYIAQVERPYRLINFELEKEDTLQVLNTIEESLSESFIQPGVRYSLQLFKNERARIDDYLKKKGY